MIPNEVFIIFSFAISGILLVVSVILAVMQSGFSIGKSNTVRAYLSESNYQKNVYRGGKAGRFYKHMTDCVYVYRVDGKPYEIKKQLYMYKKSGSLFRDGNLSEKTSRTCIYSF